MFRQLYRCTSLPVLRTTKLCSQRNFWSRPPFMNTFLPSVVSREIDYRMAQMQHEFDRVMNTSFWHPFVEHPINVEAFRIRNPIIEENGVKKFKLEFDVRRFKPEDVKITTDSKQRSLTVQAKYSDENSKFEYQRQITIPDGVTPTDITCTYKSDGVLLLEAPYIEPEKPSPPKETLIDIEHK